MYYSRQGVIAGEQESDRMFHLGWFYNYGFGVYGQGDVWSGNVYKDAARPELFIQTAQALETGGFDYIMLEDAPVLADSYGGSPAASVRYAAVRQDPFPLIPLIAAQTEHIGIIGTMSTSFTHPYSAARLTNTLDHLTNGRFGVNLVTSSPHAAAQNYGLEKHYEHDLRYEMADEWIRAVNALWETWEPDAVYQDGEHSDFADPDKVHYANFEGRWFKTRGPLNTIPSPQYKPVICQAGGSPAGRGFAATHADTIIGAVHGVENMKRYREDLDALTIEKGRKPSDVKLMHLIAPILGATEEEAQERKRAKETFRAANVERLAIGLSYQSGIDFSTFDLDAPLPDLTDRVNGHQSSYAAYNEIAKTGKTLREVLLAREDAVSVELVGTPDSVAARMGEVMDEVGGDGFLVSMPVTRRNVTEIADGLCPALRRRGLIRDGYDHATLRRNLQAF